MADKIETILRTLAEPDGTATVEAMLDHRLAEDDPGFLADLGIALDRHKVSTSRRVWTDHIPDQLLRLLVLTPGRDTLAHALRLLSARDPRGGALHRYAASLLASTRSPEELAVAFVPSSAVPQELLACLLHELILRGLTLAETPEILAWAQARDWRDHPLGRLPLSRSSVERHVAMPSYRLNMTARVGANHGSVMAEVTAAPSPPLRVLAESTPAAMAAAPANWVEDSNGEVDARVFDLAEEADPGRLAVTLAGLGLGCLDGLASPDQLRIENYPTARAFAILFAAASDGANHSDGLYGAYGRLTAWRSAGGVLGADEGASVADVDRLAREARWYRFDARTAWFDEADTWFGLLAVNGRGRRLAVLAATDSA